MKKVIRCIQTAIANLVFIASAPLAVVSAFEYLIKNDSVAVYIFIVFIAPACISGGFLFKQMHKRIQERKKTMNNSSLKTTDPIKKTERLCESGNNNKSANSTTRNSKNIKKTQRKKQRNQMNCSIENTWIPADSDPLFQEAINIAIDSGQISASILQNRLKTGYARSKRIIDQMLDYGIISAPNDLKSSRPVSLKKDWMEILSNLKSSRLQKSQSSTNNKAIYENPEFLEEFRFTPFVEKFIAEISFLQHQKNNTVQNATSERIKLYNNRFDYMDGHDFEYFCADLLRKNGYENVEVTKESGDQGIDIIAFKDGLKFGIQCKCYAKDISNSAVQEAFSGKSFYHCQVAAVLTNRNFTTSAEELAKATGVLLWNRNYLNHLCRVLDTNNCSGDIQQNTTHETLERIGNIFVQAFRDVFYVDINLVEAKSVVLYGNNQIHEFLMEGKNNEQIDYLFSKQRMLEMAFPCTFRFERLYENRFTLKLIYKNK